ncbi:MAG: tRNA (adenosine(37)-N6)-dimethylallyltransferase MiaA [Sulfurospirillum sp.]|nr:tRNA (adenosine(37)-N6)-dimethylallyltransferase MiaA [Sulfurospirillum sp.]
MKQIAILGASASGKTDLSLEMACKHNAIILSLDSLSIYKQIDIASAKPTITERGGILHFGIDTIFMDEVFNVTLFFELYKKAKTFCELNAKNLIIVGGTGFYLKSMCDGISKKPKLSDTTKEEIKQIMKDPNAAYAKIEKIDSFAAQSIKANDTYRIEKWYEIFLSTNLIASEYFQNEKKEPILKDVELFEVDVEKPILTNRITQRTKKMLQGGLIDEVVFLEKTYTREPNAMKAIGIKETLEYLDGYYNIEQLQEKICLNTLHLAKRQKTFNKTQFKPHLKGSVGFLGKKISDFFSN